MKRAICTLLLAGLMLPGQAALAQVLAEKGDGTLPASEEHLAVQAQDSAPLLVEDFSSMPPMERIMGAFGASQRLRLSTRVLLKFDAEGRVLEAKVEPSTRDRRLDAAIARWALQLRLKPGLPRTGWLPIEMAGSR